MNILVTGAAGFIGWKVSEFLLADGHTVVGVDNLNDAYDVRLKHWRLSQLEGKPGFRFHRLDITDRPALREVFANHQPNKPDRLDIPERPFNAVINLAARAGVRQSVENPWVYFETNVTGTLNLLELCKQFNIRKFVLASTSSLYGANNSIPFREDANTDGPLSPYAASKKGAEALCYTYHYLYGLDVTVLRYFTVYGPAGRPDMSLFRFVKWISEGNPVLVFGDGRQSRDFTYVEDVARGTISALRPLGFQTINLGSDHPIVLRDAIGTIEKFVDRVGVLTFKSPHPSDVNATWAEIGKAETILGWKPMVSFENGISRMVSWYHENRGWVKEVVTT